MSSDRLTGLDASFLHLEDGAAHMHVAGVMLFEGSPPAYDDLLEAIERRLGLVPRYRQRLAFVPLGQGRPKWVDDPHLNLRYHVRSTALPAPGSEQQLKDLAGRVFAQQLDRDKPLWEIWLVEGLEGDRFAMLSKTHHALVDGVSGVDIMSVLFDTSPEPAAPTDTGRALAAAPAAVLGAAARRGAHGARHDPGRDRALGAGVFRGPRRVVEGLRDAAVGVGAMAWAGLNPAPTSPVQQVDRPAPPLHLGAREPRRPEGDQERARRHRERRGARHGRRRARQAPAPPRPQHRRPRAEGDGAGERARRRGARRARQPRRGHDGAAPGLVPGPGRPPRHRPRGAQGPQVRRPGRRRPGAHRAVRLRPVHGDGPGVARDGAASASSTWSSRTCPARRSRSTSRGAA